MKKEINIIRTETWLDDDFLSITRTLEEAIEEFVDKDDRIINIEMKIDESGLSRFWIYVEKSGGGNNLLNTKIR